MKLFLLALLALPLAACGGRPVLTPPPIIVPVETSVPIAGACVPESLAGKPDYVDADAKLKAAKDAAERYQLLWGGRAQRIARLNEIEPIVAGCPRGVVK